MTGKKGLSERTVDTDPFIQFRNWYLEHLAANIEIADSVSLGTASADGRVSVRTVLLKDFKDPGFVFYTNYHSKKGFQLSSNSRAALLFYWPESGRQIRIEGVAGKITEKESESYFLTRPRESQLGAWASQQSSVIPDRQHLEEKYAFYENRYRNKPVEKPSYWGGYLLVPDWFEFWQNGEFRLHDRITYSKKDENWIIERLSP